MQITQNKSSKEDKITPIAHRGGNEVAPENTIASFKDAYNLGYRWLETDVRLSKDKVLYAFHDENLNRLLGKPNKFSELNSWEIDGLLIDSKHQIPRFDFLANTFSDVVFNVDAKTFEAAEVLVNLINTKRIKNDLCVGSFQQATIKYMRENIFRDVESAFSMQEVLNLFFHRITKKSGDFAGTCLQIPLKYFGINLITSNLINYCKKNNIKVHVWTINDEAEMARLVELGINGIMTDKCTSLLKVLQKQVDFNS